jgi:hypothetical protein
MDSAGIALVALIALIFIFDRLFGTIVILAPDFEYWLKKYHKKLYRKVKRGHTELITKEIEDEFVEWYQSENNAETGAPKF